MTSPMSCSHVAFHFAISSSELNSYGLSSFFAFSFCFAISEALCFKQIKLYIRKNREILNDRDSFEYVKVRDRVM